MLFLTTKLVFATVVLVSSRPEEFLAIFQYEKYAIVS